MNQLKLIQIQKIKNDIEIVINIDQNFKETELEKKVKELEEVGKKMEEQVKKAKEKLKAKKIEYK